MGKVRSRVLLLWLDLAAAYSTRIGPSFDVKCWNEVFVPRFLVLLQGACSFLEEPQASIFDPSAVQFDRVEITAPGVTVPVIANQLPVFLSTPIQTGTVEIQLNVTEDSVLVGALKLLAGAFAVVTMTYQGFAMSHSSAIAIWNSAILPLASFLYSLATGVAVLMLIPGAGSGADSDPGSVRGAGSGRVWSGVRQGCRVGRRV